MEVKKSIKIFDDNGKEIKNTDKVTIKMKNGDVYTGNCFDSEIMYCSFSFASFNNTIVKIYYHDIDSVIILN